MPLIFSKSKTHSTKLPLTITREHQSLRCNFTRIHHCHSKATRYALKQMAKKRNADTGRKKENKSDNRPKREPGTKQDKRKKKDTALFL